MLNGGFEYTDSTPSALLGWTTSGSASRTASDTKIGEGAYSMQLNPEEYDSASVLQTVSLTAGTYTLSFPYVSREFEGATATVGVIVSENLIRSAQIETNDYAADIASFFMMTFSVSINSNVTIEICVDSESAQNASLVLDQITLNRGSAATEYSLVMDGSFDIFGNASLQQRWESSSVSTALIHNSAAPFNASLRLQSQAGENYVKQRVFEAKLSDLLLGTETYPDEDLILSGYANAENALLSGNSPFRLTLRIAYYQGENQDDVIVDRHIDFLPGVKGWQFASGTFNTVPDEPEADVDYSKIRYIDVICEYSSQPSGYALFDDISLTRNTTGSGNIEKFLYNENGYLAAHRSGDYAEYYLYDTYNNLFIQANNRGEMKRYLYNATWSPYLVTEAYTEAFEDLNGTTEFPYDLDDPYAGINIVDIKSKTTYSYYPPYSLVKSEKTERLIRDTDGTYTTHRLPIVTEYSYDLTSGSKAFGALTQVSDLGASTVKYFYDSDNGRLMAEVDVGSGTGVTYGYNSIGKLISVTPATYQNSSYSSVSGAERVEYEYDSAQRLSKITTESTSYNISYDAFGNKSGISIGEGDAISSYTYNQNNGKLNKITYANGYSVEYVYNELELLYRVYYNSTYRQLAYQYEYNADGSIYRCTDYLNYTTTTYRYDLNGRLVGTTVMDEVTDFPSRFATEYEYNDRGQLSGRSHIMYTAVGTDSSSLEYDYVAGTLFSSTYEYNAGGSLSSYNYTAQLNGNFNSLARVQEYTYDNFGRLESTTDEDAMPNGTGPTITTEYEYVDYAIGTEEDATSSRVGYYSTSVNQSGTAYSYLYDSRGNIVQITIDPHDGSAAKRISYKYDDLGQLIRENNPLTGETVLYTYDNAGNITKRRVYSYTMATTPTGLIDELTYTYGNSDWGDQLTAFDGNSITYDAMGNPLSYNNGNNEYEFVWQNRQLIEVYTEELFGRISYDESGRIVYSDTGGRIQNLYYDGDLLVMIDYEFAVYHFFYDAQGSPIGFGFRARSYWEDDYEAIEYYWYEKNLQGDIVALYDNSGTKILSYVYDAWGNMSTVQHVVIDSNVLRNPFTYRGYYYDHDLGMYYLGSRWYDPVLGRFISPDAVISSANGSLHGLNLYAYCFNNPIKLVDEDGYWPTLNDAKAWFNSKIATPTRTFVSKIVEDFRNYDKDNTSMDSIDSANYFSSYRGVTVIKVGPDGFAMSFGGIFLGDEKADEDTLNHEYGHYCQLQEMGVFKYTAEVALPSVTASIVEMHGELPFQYYTSPWESQADVYGGVVRDPTKIKEGYDELRPWNEQDGRYAYLIPIFFG